MFQYSLILYCFICNDENLYIYIIRYNHQKPQDMINFASSMKIYILLCDEDRRVNVSIIIEV